MTKTYRSWIKDDDLVSFRVMIKESDLLIRADKDLKEKAEGFCKKYRNLLDEYINYHPKFLHSLKPIAVDNNAPEIVKAMIREGQKVNVGPMAAVAGAIAEYIGQDLLRFSSEVIVENGGDIFMKVGKKRLVGVYAGDSLLSGKIGIEIAPDDTPLGICTSSGTFGHSLSFGRADAVVALSRSTALADACATAVGNLIKIEPDIEHGLSYARKIEGIKGLVVILGKYIGVWGEGIKFAVPKVN